MRAKISDEFVDKTSQVFWEVMVDLKKQVAELTELVAEENNPQKFLELLTRLNEILDRLNHEESRRSASSGESES